MLRENLAEELQRLSAQGIAAQRFVRGQYVADLVAHAKRGMQRKRRLLINERYSSAANSLEYLGFYLKEVVSFELNGAFLNTSVPRKEPQKCGG